MKKIFSIFMLFIFGWSSVLPPHSLAQTSSVMPLMPEPGTMLSSSEPFTPAYLQGVTIDPMNALKFDFLIRKGDQHLTPDQKQEEYTRLVKYFLTALTIPDSDQWVNLSPYEGDRLVNDQFGLTAMGRDLLAQDYLLKQLAASLTHPDTALGKKYWSEFYRRAHEKFGSADVPLESFNKVWIIPDTAVVYEKETTAYLLTQRLKVMTERDYLAYKSQSGQPVSVLNSPSGENEAFFILSSEVLRDVIIPEIELEVNQGKSFTVLRQICTAMVLATWYKRALKESVLSRVYADQGRVAGVDQPDCSSKGGECSANRMIWQKYMEAFRKGVFNMIREDVDQYSQELIPRKYFSGGLARAEDPAQLQIVSDYASLPLAARDAARQLQDAAFDSAAAVLEPRRTQTPDSAQESLPVTFVAYSLLKALNLTHMGLLGREPFQVADINAVNQEKIFQLGGSARPADPVAFQAALTILMRHWKRILKAFFLSVRRSGVSVRDAGSGQWLQSVWNAEGRSRQEDTIKKALSELVGQNARLNGLTESRQAAIEYLLRTLTRVWEERQNERFEVPVTYQEFADKIEAGAVATIFDHLISSGILYPDPDNPGVAVFADGMNFSAALERLAESSQKDILFRNKEDIELVLETARSRMDIDAAQEVAETTALQNKEAVGGIDLNAANWQLQVRKDANGVPLPAAQQDMESLRVDGFVPNILSIRPVSGISI